MATVTDLEKNIVSATDLTSQKSSGTVSRDSNINVFELANLLFAGLLPSVLEIILHISDYEGVLVPATDTQSSSLTLSDTTQSNSQTYDFSAYTYDQSSINYEGHPAQGDTSDFGGCSSVGTDVSVEAIVQEDFSGAEVSGVDTEFTVMTISDALGSNTTPQDKTVSNSEVYDFATFTYEQTSINYDGYPIQGAMVDISGS